MFADENIIMSENKDIKFIVNGKVEFDVDLLEDCSFISTGENTYRVLYKERLFDIAITHLNHRDKTYSLKVNGIKVDLKVETEMDLLIQRLGMNKLHETSANDILAPMPGLILDVLVNEGDHIHEGDKLLVLEAMKMENLLRAPGSGTIKFIKVSKGDKVDKNQLLIVID